MAKFFCFMAAAIFFYSTSVVASTPLFDTPISYSTGSGPASIFAADLDGDNDQDLVVANTYDSTVSVLKNNGDGSFASKVDYWTAEDAWAIYK